MSDQMDNDELMVSIRCLAYNHEPYIRQCLEGFIMQKTNFRFEAVVHDDASTDGTVAIIREYAEKYPNIIKPIYETQNQYSKHDGSLGRRMSAACTGKYIAMCEGDDYWIDPYKLQKQVDFLETHLDYSMSHTSFRYFYEQENKFYISRDIEINSNIQALGLKPENVLKDYRIQTLTILVRTKLYQKIVESDYFLFKSGYLKMGDVQLWYSLSMLGKIHFLPDVTGVYRKNQGSVTRANSVIDVYRFRLSSWELRMYLCLRDSLSESYKKQVEINYSRALFKYLCFDKSFNILYPLNKKDLGYLLCLEKMHVLKFVLKIIVYYRGFLGRVKRLFTRSL